MTRATRASTVAVVLMLTGGCEKAGESTAIEGSGELSATERQLFSLIPAGSNLVFGGNYQKLMKYWETSPLKKLGESFTAATSPDQTDGMRDYMTCWVEEQHATDLAGALEVKPGAIGMIMVFRGVTAKTLETCADKGGLKYQRDADGKYIELAGLSNGMGGTASVGYYFPAPDTAYFAFDMPLGMTPGMAPPPVARAEIEARLAKAKSASAADDAQVRGLIARADRTKPFWFSGTATGTPLAGKVGSGHGWLDADASSLTFAFSVELGEAGAASQAVSSFEEAKKSVDQLPPQLKDAATAFLADAKLTSSGKTLNGRFRLTNEVLEKAAPALQSLMGGVR
jgi:hypothetical protein